MASRIAFKDKYSSLAKKWQINDNELNDIIKKYTKQFADELDLLKTKKLELSRYYKDIRTDGEYLYDLIDGWLIEDIIRDAWLYPRVKKINCEIEIIHTGSDKDRVVQKSDPTKISTFPDFILKINAKKETRIEFQMARAERNSEGYDIKKTKFIRATKENNLFLWVIIPINKYFIVSPLDLKEIKPIRNDKWGGKLVYNISSAMVDKIGIYEMGEDIPQQLYQIIGL